ncbi:MAG: glycosyltransferase family protein, partial [Burkholderiales bacterium]|nr:glycosyltransferase family protein [Burkholderiales bacterium]
MTPTPDFETLWAEAHACHQRGDARGAVLALYRAVALSPDDMRSLAHLCRTLYEHAELFAPPPAPPATGPAPLVSVVTCSIDAAKYGRVKASFARAFGEDPWELVGIHDAKSLCEGYARGFAQARGDLVVFSHDDIE